MRGEQISLEFGSSFFVQYEWETVDNSLCLVPLNSDIGDQTVTDIGTTMLNLFLHVIINTAALIAGCSQSL